MAVEATPSVRWIALEVSDESLYERYRAAMMPILERYGGRFAHDFSVSHVWRSTAGERTNRVFAIAFPDRSDDERFFADPDYRAVRRALFQPSVARVVELSV